MVAPRGVTCEELPCKGGWLSREGQVVGSLVHHLWRQMGRGPRWRVSRQIFLGLLLAGCVVSGSQLRVALSRSVRLRKILGVKRT